MNGESLISVNHYIESDGQFNELYPHSIQLMAKRHWTPLHIAKLATDFLAENQGAKILDIGSGAGKFCLAGALYNPGVKFYGVEQRKYLIDHAAHAQKRLGVKNVSFIEGNFTQLDLKQFDHFYFFNSFFENLDDFDRIDEMIHYSEGLYEYYVRYLHTGLKGMPAGTKIVTYHSLMEEIPREYSLLETLENGELSFWIKQ
jgi:SAM-dependent methyltransferase